jgi:O-6-methylguanine DNA methyltransferase
MIACSFTEESRKLAETAILQSISPHERCTRVNPSAISTKFQELRELYEGKGKVKKSSLDLSLISPFRRSVYSQLSRIPRGRVTTYGIIAKKLGSRRYARAVGTANATNPMPLAIPCHRVIPSTLNVGNYGRPGRKPSEGSQVKRKLLEREGVRFEGSKVSRKSLWYLK